MTEVTKKGVYVKIEQLRLASGLLFKVRSRAGIGLDCKGLLVFLLGMLDNPRALVA